MQVDHVEMPLFPEFSPGCKGISENQSSSIKTTLPKLTMGHRNWPKTKQAKDSFWQLLQPLSVTQMLWDELVK